MPVFLFAASLPQQVDWVKGIGAFLLIHLLLYPASNGYNSHQDRDEGPIGGVENPLPVSKELYHSSLVMDGLGLVLAFFISPLFAVLYAVYILFSRLYSYRGIRLKRYAVWGYLTVIVNQGALIFFMAYHAIDALHPASAPWQGMVVSSLLIGAFYPITQVYQHAQDRADGVTTISYKLGVRGTFIYCAVLYTIAFGLLAWYLFNLDRMGDFLILQLWFVPVVVWFLVWAVQCWKDASKANFKNTMRMNWLAASGTNGAFLTLILLHHLG